MTQANIHIDRTDTYTISCEEESVLKALAYFDVFYYPLTQQEIQSFLDRKMAATALANVLSALQKKALVFLYEEFYSLHNNPLLIHRRKQGNGRAEQLLMEATRIGSFLFKFPFVRAVGVSGSLSKNFADDKADIDFFIITKTNRLWISRTMMHLYKKLTFITGRQHFFV